MGDSVEDDNIVPVDTGDPEMAAAIRAARASLSEFLMAFDSPKPNQGWFLLKVKFIQGESVEHIWMEDLDLSSEPYSGALGNEPCLPGLIYKDRYSFEADRISDWMFREDGKLVGGYTIKLLLKRQQAAKSGCLKWLKRLLGRVN